MRVLERLVAIRQATLLIGLIAVYLALAVPMHIGAHHTTNQVQANIGIFAAAGLYALALACGLMLARQSVYEARMPEPRR